MDAKLGVCCNVLKSASATAKEKDSAVKTLFNKDDGAALARGIVTILPDPSLLAKYEPNLQEIVMSGGRLGALDLKDEGLTGTLPASVFQLLGSAEYFNLHGNEFSNVMAGTALYDMVYRMTNWRDRTELVWKDDLGGGIFSSVPGEVGLFKSLTTLDLSSNSMESEL